MATTRKIALIPMQMHLGSHVSVGGILASPSLPSCNCVRQNEIFERKLNCPHTSSLRANLETLDLTDCPTCAPSLFAHTFHFRTFRLSAMLPFAGALRALL